MERLPISCCYIVKDEAEFLRHSLSSVAPYCSELIVCDSGSRDGSPEIATSFHNQVPQFVALERAWTDHFADARNFVASKATQPWILFVDGDESIEAEDWERIRKLISRPEGQCYSLIQRNYVTSPGVETAVPLGGGKPTALRDFPHTLYFFENHMERLYRNGLGLTYTGRVHESLIPKAQELGLRVEKTDVVLHHYGRLKKPSDKYLYYLKLSQEKLREEPTNPAAWIEVCVNLMELQQMKEAYEVASIAAKQFPQEPEISRVAFQAALRAEAYPEAEIFIRKYLSFYPDDLFAKTQLTTALLYQRKFSDVLSLATEIFARDPKNFVTHVNCAVIHFENQDWSNAARHLHEGLQLRPHDQFLIDAMSKIPSEFQIH